MNNGKLVLRVSLGVALLAAVVAVTLYAYSAGLARGLLQVPQAVYLNVENLYFYNSGLAQGLAESGQVPGVAMPQSYPGRPFGYGPFGFGFGALGCLFPLLFFAFIFVLLRGLWWHRRWHGGWHHHGPWERHVPPFVEEWHRQAHQSGPKQA